MSTHTSSAAALIQWFQDRGITDPQTQKVVEAHISAATGFMLEENKGLDANREMARLSIWFLYCMWRVADERAELDGKTDRAQQARWFADDLRKYADKIESDASAKH